MLFNSVVSNASLFCELFDTKAGFDFIMRHLERFDLKKLKPQTMHHVVNVEGPCKGVTPFYVLADNANGRKIIYEKWDDFVRLGLLSAESMHQVVSGEGPNKGQTAFYWLASTSEGR